MATSFPRRQCANSDDCKQIGVAQCEGCSRVFCTKHFDDHRRSLDEEMDVIFNNYNDLTNAIVQDPDNSNLHSLTQEIDNWEKESVERIQQKATDLRQEMLKMKTTHTENLSLQLQSLAERMKKAREQDDFVETDLLSWKNKLSDLKSNLLSPSMFSITRHDDIPLVNSISLSFLSSGKELFSRTFNNDVGIEEDGEVVVGLCYFMVHNEIRGKNDYASGCHRVCLRIEQTSNQWVFLGVNSKLTPLQQSSHLAKSAYGWCNNNYVYSNGSYQYNKTHPPIQINRNDIISLFFDCDGQKIVMINESTGTKHALTVDIINCPFPWQLHVILSQKYSRIRILSS
jgi:hypothetical protein